MSLNTPQEIIEELRQGRMVVIMDDEDRENEGDLLMVAEKATPESINFMARYGRGLICLTLSKERCHQLRLPLMVSDNKESNGTAFTVSIDWEIPADIEPGTYRVLLHGSQKPEGADVEDFVAETSPFDIVTP